MENVKDLNLTELVSAVIRKIWLVVLCAVIVGALAYAYTANFVTPMYRSSVTIYVNNNLQTTGNTGISASDLATSQRLVDTYINILKSDTVLTKVAEQANVGVSAAGIRYMMSAAAEGETEVFKVYISNADPQIAATVANAIADVAPAEIAYFVEGSSTKIVDYAKVANMPYSPNKTGNTTVGMIAGALAAVCFIVLQTLLDVRVKGEEDLAAISNAPVLGLIPDLAMEMKDGYGYKGYRGYKAYGGYTSDESDAKPREGRK